jgi:hypothetical protein
VIGPHVSRVETSDAVSAQVEALARHLSRVEEALG